MKRATVKQVEQPVEPPDDEPEPSSVPDSETALESVPDAPAETTPPPAAPPTAKEPAREKLSPNMKRIRDEEESGLRDWLQVLSADGGVFRVALRRTEPKHLRNPKTGQDVSTEGHLRSYDEFPDEDQIQREFGGGKYHIKVMRQNERGSWKFVNHRHLTIAGDPRLDHLPLTAEPTTVAPTMSHEEPTIAKAAFNLMAEQLKIKNERPPDREIDPAIRMMFEQNREAMAALRRQLDAVQTENAALRNQKPPDDPFRDKMLDTLMTGDSARLTALRAQHESELRQLREGFTQDIKRIEDRHDRTIEAMRRSHDDAAASIKMSYEREIAAMRLSHETAFSAAKTTAEVQAHTLKAEIDRLTRDNTELRQDVKELREKKEKSIIDSIEEVEKLKDLIGSSDGEKSGIDKVVEAFTSPTAVEGIGKIISRIPGVGGGQPGMPEGMMQNPATMRPRVVQDQSGQKFIQVGNQVVPARRKPKIVTTSEGAQIEVPAIEPDTIKTMLSLLENAFSNRMEPEIVAQSARPHMPVEVMGWVQEHGIDLFMSKVAKLPGTSPLMSQAGKNWLRKVGEVLTGTG